MVFESKRPSFAELNTPPLEEEEQADPETIDTGIPLKQLADLGEPVSEGFFQRVMGRVESGGDAGEGPAPRGGFFGRLLGRLFGRRS